MSLDPGTISPLARPLALALALAAPLGGACGESGPKRVTLPVEVAGSAAAALANEHGYTVELTAAKAHLGPIYFFSGEPLFTRRGGELPPAAHSAPWHRRLWRELLGGGVAHAHPGHYQEGDALGEVLQPATFDLLAADSAPLGEAAGVTGRYRSAQVTLSNGADNDGHAVVIAGTARKGDERVDFSAALDLELDVRGVAFGAEISDGAGRVRLTVDLARWIERVDFSALDGASGPVTIDAATPQADNALRRGVENTSAYLFSWHPSER